ncbi:MAG: Rab family GTPase [Promethearchaeota archaeon]
MDRKTVALTHLSANLCSSLPEMHAILITDRKCQILFSYNRENFLSERSENSDIFTKSEKSEKSNIRTEVISSINAQLDPILDQIRQKDTGEKYTSAIFEGENYRVFNLFVDKWIFIFVLSFESFIDRLNPYIFLTSEKFYRILSNEQNIDLHIPKLGNILGQHFLPTDGKIQNWAFKFTIIGDSGVGKTSLVSRFVDGMLHHDFRPTIGVNVLTHTYTFMDNRVKLNIFDIGSQKFFKRIRRMYYQGSNAAIIVFDLNSRETFLSVAAWRAEFEEYVDGDYILILVGNKSDLEREVSIEEVQELTRLWNVVYIETSALYGENVEEMFVMTTFNIIKKMQELIRTWE